MPTKLEGRATDCVALLPKFERVHRAHGKRFVAITIFFNFHPFCYRLNLARVLVQDTALLDGGESLKMAPRPRVAAPTVAGGVSVLRCYH
jgi:hypothetical protein